MRRREFIAGLGVAAAWPLAARAQRSSVPVIGYLGFPEAPGHAAVLEGLAEVGYVEGHNVAIEYRLVATAEENEKLPALLRDLIERRVAVLVTVGSTAMALAAKAATQTIPIVFRIGGDPVARGLVPSLSKPGGNVTGTTTLGVELGPKRLEVLSELIPAGATVALFTNPANANAAAEVRAIQAAADALGLRLLVLHASSPSELDAAFERIAQQDIHGVLTAADPFIIVQHDRIFALAATRAIPGVYSSRIEFAAGGLISYGASALHEFRVVGNYVGRILSGEKPADLPVQRSTKVELAINLKVAKALGITVPAALPHQHWRRRSHLLLRHQLTRLSDSLSGNHGAAFGSPRLISGRLAARAFSNFATLRFRIGDIAEAALTQPGAATRRDLLDALAEAEF
jgi:putative tryptophan/tyrosine transport system substrate-binding protein